MHLNFSSEMKLKFYFCKSVDLCRSLIWIGKAKKKLFGFHLKILISKNNLNLVDCFVIEFQLKNV